MPKALFTTHYHKYVLKIGIVTLASLLGQSAFAACPDTAGINIEANTVNTAKTIYFCKQEFPDTALIFKPSATDLVPGGSQVISKGNTIQTAALGGSINLAGFNLIDLSFNNISANFPNTDGQFGSPSLFNFYTKTNNNDDCGGSGGQHQSILNYLRSNPSVFQTIPLSRSATSDTSGSNIAKITGAKLKSDIDPAKEFVADISLYHANAGRRGQYFTNGRVRYCWVGVGTRVRINPNNSNLKYAGDYNLQIGIQPQ